MDKNSKITGMRFLPVSGLIAVMVVFSGFAGGRGGGFHGGGFHGGGFHGGGFQGGYHSHEGFRSHNWGGFFIGPEWFWGPTVVISDVPYYYYDGVYYTPYEDGFVAVEEPIAQPEKKAAPAAVAPSKEPSKNASVQPGAAEETITINVPNSQGGFTPVSLVKHEKGYIGPQGEFYPEHPTIAQLQVLYGN